MVPAYLENGWTVIATMRDSKKRSSLFDAEMKKHAGRLFCEELDVSKASDRAAIIQLIEKQFAGRLDALVNNAGFGLFGIFEELSEEKIRYQMEVNFFGVLLLTQSLLSILRRNQGIIFNFSSIMGIMAPPVSSLYCASKFAIEGWSESLHYELKPHGVRVVMIEPGGFKTDFGKNIVQTQEGAVSSSPYAVQSQKHQAFRQKLATGKGGDPQVIVDRVLQISQSGANPVRVILGKDARSADFLQRIIPRKIWSFLLSISYRKMFSA